MGRIAALVTNFYRASLENMAADLYHYDCCVYRTKWVADPEHEDGGAHSSPRSFARHALMALPAGFQFVLRTMLCAPHRFYHLLFMPPVDLSPSCVVLVARVGMHRCCAGKREVEQPGEGLQAKPIPSGTVKEVFRKWVKDYSKPGVPMAHDGMRNIYSPEDELVPKDEPEKWFQVDIPSGRKYPHVYMCASPRQLPRQLPRQQPRQRSCRLRRPGLCMYA